MARYILDGVVLHDDTPFTKDDVFHPRGPRGYSPAERQMLGLVEIVEQPRPDDWLAYVSEDPDNLGGWISTPMPLEQRLAKLWAYAAAKRWEKETGGIVVNGISVPTDERTQGVLTGARAKVLADPTYSVPDWKIAPGTYITLDAATITAISDAVAAHVQTCFSLNKQVDEQIAAGTITTYEQVDAAFV